MDETNNQANQAPAAESASTPEASQPQQTPEQGNPQSAPAPTAPVPEPIAQAQEPTGGLLDQADDEPPQSETVQGAPESYTPFTDEQGNEYPSEALGDFTAAARDLGLTQEQAQKMFGVMLPQAQKYTQERLKTYGSQWAEAAKADPEFGGEHLKENLAIAKHAYNAMATDELKTILQQSQLSNHPEFIRLFYRIGSKMQQDRGVAGSASSPSPKRVLYPKSNMVEDM